MAKCDFDLLSRLLMNIVIKWLIVMIKPVNFKENILKCLKNCSRN